MTEQEPGVQQENIEAGEEPLPAVTWDSALARASELRDSEIPVATAARQESVLLRWVKLFTPLIVIAFFGLYQIFSDWPFQSPALGPAVRPEAPTLTGVNPVNDDSLKLSEAGREVLMRLEALRQRSDWTTIAKAVAAEQRPEIANHPLIQAMALIARTRAGERSVQLEKRIIDELATLESRRSDYPELVQELSLARAQLMIHRSRSPEILALNMDTLAAILGDEIESPYEVRIRNELAQTLAAIGDRLLEQADGYLQDDPDKAHQARTFYRSALRMIVEPHHWEQLRAISHSSEPIISQIVGRMRRANSLYHGYALPLTGRDSETWSGNKGGLVHDRGQSL